MGPIYRSPAGQIPGRLRPPIGIYSKQIHFSSSYRALSGHNTGHTHWRIHKVVNKSTPPPLRDDNNNQLYFYYYVHSWENSLYSVVGWSDIYVSFLRYNIYLWRLKAMASWFVFIVKITPIKITLSKTSPHLPSSPILYTETLPHHCMILKISKG